MLYTLPLGAVQSIAMSMSLCLSVCLSCCISQKTQIPDFVYILPMAMACPPLMTVQYAMYFWFYI